MKIVDIAVKVVVSLVVTSASFGAVDDPLGEPVLDPETPLRELRAYVRARVPRMTTADSLSAWEARAKSIRHELLDKVVFQGEAARWRDSQVAVEWLGAVKGGSGYRIRKFRYEAIPGFWFPALLYEPTHLKDKVPVFLNVNGHDELGKSTPQKQLRCINLAKRGILAYSLEFIYMGQLRLDGNQHNRLAQLDVCGTSGVAPFYLALTRGLDAALSHEWADANRVGVAGLSGGGWQTIILASLDERITLANPVAGYASMLTRTEHSRDVGDSEQIASDFCTIADYTHLTALMAPRPLLLTYNSKDECCFLPEHSLPPLEAAARPIYQLYGRADRFRTHINDDPGTHNFERDNREALYRLIGAAFFAGDPQFDFADVSVSDAELKSAKELNVSLPSGNATLNSLAEKISRKLPLGSIPTSESAAAAWRLAAKDRLHDILHFERYEAQPLIVREMDAAGVHITCMKLEFDDEWTLPVVEYEPTDARSTVVLCGDKGRGSLKAVVDRHLAAGDRVVAIDLLGFGEARGTIDPYELTMIATVGRRPLGIQAGQLAAVSRWLRRKYADSPVELIGVGPRSCVVVLTAAALVPEEVASVKLFGAWDSLKVLIDQNMDVRDAPELFCFGLLKEFDMPQLAAMVAPRPVVHRAPIQQDD